jgi:gluconate kinase
MMSDADCFHSTAAKEKMSRGEPLTDMDKSAFIIPKK